MSSAADINAILAQFQQLATDLVSGAVDEINNAFSALGNSALYAYSPYEYQIPEAPIIGGIDIPAGPSQPVSPGIPKQPTIVDIGMNVPNPDFGVPPIDASQLPNFNFPTPPSSTAPTNLYGQAPGVSNPNEPNPPTLLPLPSSTLPYPTVNIPVAPVITPPTFTGSAPEDISTMTLDEYLGLLDRSYKKYSQMIPQMVQDNWMSWFRIMVNENPTIRQIDAIIQSYLTTGGGGIPAPIEEAIVTRATDRVAAEARRERMAVWEKTAAFGFNLPSGALMSGLKESRAKMAEAVSKVSLDVAQKNLEIEHDQMKFMITMGVELQKMLLGFAGDTAKTVAELNAQAIEMTKVNLQGMIAVYDMLVKVYLAKWEGYRAATEVYKAMWEGIEAQVRAYEAEIRAELAKTEVDKAVVDVLRTVAQANESIVQVYKTEVEAANLLLEADRIRIMAFEAQVRAYVAQVEAYRAQWEGYAAGVKGQQALADVYVAEVQGFKADTEAYAARVGAYGEQVRAYSAQVQAISEQNQTNLKAWSIEIDALFKAYSEQVRAYGLNWSALGEQMRASANVLGIQSEFLTKVYNVGLQIEIERAREHLATWREQLEAGLRAGEGLANASHVTANLAGAVLSGFTTFAGNLSTSQGT